MKTPFIVVKVVFPLPLHSKIKKRMKQEGYGFHELSAFCKILIQRALKLNKIKQRRALDG